MNTAAPELQALTPEVIDSVAREFLPRTPYFENLPEEQVLTASKFLAPLMAASYRELSSEKFDSLGFARLIARLWSLGLRTGLRVAELHQKADTQALLQNYFPNLTKQD